MVEIVFSFFPVDWWKMNVNQMTVHSAMQSLRQMKYPVSYETFAVSEYLKIQIRREPFN